jgi:beta-phosphoglucomutase-like phosphatase (HAD superfamily)
MPLPTQLRLNEHLMRWDATIRQFDQAIHEYGERKADLEYRRAVVKELAKAEDPKIAVSRMDTLADADEAAYRLHRQYREAESTVEGLKARLRWCQAVSDALRSEVSTERAEAQLYRDHSPDP